MRGTLHSLLPVSGMGVRKLSLTPLVKGLLTSHKPPNNLSMISRCVMNTWSLKSHLVVFLWSQKVTENVR